MMSVVSEGWGNVDDCRHCRWSMVIWYCETLPVFVEATTRNCHTLHSYWDLSLLVSNMKSKSNPAFLGFSLSFAFLPKVDGGSQFGKTTVLFQQQNVNIVCIFSHRHPIIFCPLPHHPHNVLHLKDKCFPKYMNCKVVFRVGVEFQYWISEATLLSVKWAGVEIHKITKRTKK